MLFQQQTRRCLKCGQTFTFIQGDLILELFPKCPKCGSHITIKVPFL